MNPPKETLTVRAAPALFVLLWSTGFIVTKLALQGTQPLTWLAMRMAVTICLLLVLAAVTRPTWPRGWQIVHSIVAGLLVQCVYLSGVTLAIGHAIPAGLSALIPGLQPILTSTLASRFLGERVTPLQWAGLLLGLVGVLFVMHDRQLTGQAGWGWVASVASLSASRSARCTRSASAAASTGGAGNLVQFGAARGFASCSARCCSSRRRCTWTDESRDRAVLVALVLSVGSIGAVVLADPPLRRDPGREPVLPGARGHRRARLRVVRRAARRGSRIGGMVLCAVGVIIVNRAAQAT